MRNTPLLPRPWPVPVAGTGADHSTCSWQSPKLCLVVMSVSFTVATPSFTIHLSPFSQAERSLPSNRMMASDGGAPHVLPGVTIGGSSHFIPLRYSLWAAQGAEANRVAPNRINVVENSFLSIVEVPQRETDGSMVGF